MRGTLVIYRRELAGLFLTPLGWLLLALALFANGLFLYLVLPYTGGDVGSSLRGALGGGTLFWALMVFLPPLLAMRMMAEESRSGTLEYLLTAPVSDSAVVVGKFLAAATFLALIWSVVPLYGLLFQLQGSPPDWGAVFATWLGAVLTSGLFVSLGLLAATSTNTPLLAAFLAFAACLGWILVPSFGGQLLNSLDAFVGTGDLGGLLVQTLRSSLQAMDVLRHFHFSWRMGVIDTAEVVFFCTWPCLFLFATVRMLEGRRWRV
jgi:ABC-2 type transport system permease protein